ncbi:putative RNA-directed DNA polymerase from transposon BS [Stylophora pistillata]|uniref:Putative RNA-directed DNA polymerase from transposon BS n=1 Tax=Stylophora pistillata TaxID=50429 RepID=A0A2B4R848_STYPI|nr:putative RNA-directed DNA polymerase from transposon BS [Stylophora pistillata]
MIAYRRHHSFQTTLLRLVEDWKSAVERKELVYMLSTDLIKAFDSLSHSLIVKKLEAYGIGQNSLNLLRSYFDNRFNRVKIKGVTSDWKRMVLGCPQGSSFGPRLWNLFQNDMSFHINNANLSMYADHHQMYVTGKKHDVVAQSIKIHGEKALSWYKNNYLSTNPEKFQLLTINPRNVDKDNDNQNFSVDAEAAVKSMKKLLIKTHKEGSDPLEALLEHRNTPRQDVGLSPAELMFKRKTRSLVPSFNKHSSNDPIEVRRQARKDTVKKSHDRKAKSLPVPDIGQSIFFQHLEGRDWKFGEVSNILGPSTYEVKRPDGSTDRRNRVHDHLRPTKVNLKTRDTSPSHVPHSSKKRHQKNRGRLPNLYLVKWQTTVTTLQATPKAPSPTALQQIDHDDP